MKRSDAAALRRTPQGWHACSGCSGDHTSKYSPHSRSHPQQGGQERERPPVYTNRSSGSSGQQPPDPVDIRLLVFVVVLAIGIAIAAVAYSNPALGAAVLIGITVMSMLLAVLKWGGGGSP